jgi:hypothetical protein
MIAANPSVAEYRFKSMNADAKASDWHSPCRGVLKAAPFDSSFVNRFAVLRQFKANQREGRRPQSSRGTMHTITHRKSRVH